MSTYAVTNPATGIIEATYATATEAQLAGALDRADSAFRTWSRHAVQDRSDLLNRVADLYEERRDELAAIITREMGKPIFQAGIEIDIVASIYRYYADNGPTFLETRSLRSRRAARPSSARKHWECSWASCRGTSRTTRWPGSRLPT